MLSNEQRAHEVTILYLQLMIPVIQKNFRQSAVDKVGFNFLEEYLKTYATVLAALEKQLNDAEKQAPNV